MKDHLSDLAYLAFGRHTGLTKDWFGFFFWMIAAGISVGIMIVVVNNI